MKLVGKIVVGVFAVLGMLFVALQIATKSKSDCRRESVDFIASPNGDYQLEINKRACRNETPTIAVWIYKANSRSSTVIFQADLISNLPLEISWVDAHKIVIGYPSSFNIVNYKSFFEDIYIETGAIDRLGGEYIANDPVVDVVIRSATNITVKDQVLDLETLESALINLRRQSGLDIDFDLVSHEGVELELVVQVGKIIRKLDTASEVGPSE
jgi:hypothetical protein